MDDAGVPKIQSSRATVESFSVPPGRGKKLHPPKDVGSWGKAMPQGVDLGPPGRKSRHLEKDNSCLPLMEGHPFY